MRLNERLNERESRFLASLMQGLPQTVAARSSGSSTGHAANLLRRPHVAAVVREMAARLGKVAAWIDADQGKARS
jgi:phage terminase small subunit